MLGFILAVFLGLLVIGAPIAISLVFTTLAACFTNPFLPIDGVYIYKNLVMSLNSYAILAVPLFVFFRYHHGSRRYFQEALQFLCIFYRKSHSRSPGSFCRHLPVLRRYFRIRSRNYSCSRQHGGAIS